MGRFKRVFFSFLILLATICLNAMPPAVPTLIRIFDNAIFNAYPPPYACTLSVRSTDPEGDSIEYEIYWDYDTLFGSPNDTLAGLFASGAIATIVIPLGSEAEAESLHYWKARARDPNESNTWSSWSEIRSFTMELDIPQTSVYWYLGDGPQFATCECDQVSVQGDSVVLASAIIDTCTFEPLPFPPSGWEVLDLDNTNKGWKRSSVFAHGGIRSARCEKTTDTVFQVLVTPKIDLTSYFACTLTSFLLDDSASLYQHHALWISTSSQTDTSQFTEVDIIPATAEETWEEYKFSLSAYEDEDTVYIGYCYREMDGTDWYMDDHEVTGIHKAGTLTTQAIAYADLVTEYPGRSSWVSAEWAKSHEDDSIGLQIEYLSGGSWALVPDLDLSGNSSGFYDLDTTFCDIDLSGLDTATYDTLRMRVVFKQYGTTNPSLKTLTFGNAYAPSFVEPVDEQENFVILSKMNPFFQNTIIEYHLPEISDVRIAIFDVMGREINVLLKEREEKGTHSITWNGTNSIGSLMPAGVYFVRMEAGKVSKSCKVSHIR
jgi:hypothetical protein